MANILGGFQDFMRSPVGIGLQALFPVNAIANVPIVDALAGAFGGGGGGSLFGGQGGGRDITMNTKTLIPDELKPLVSAIVQAQMTLIPDAQKAALAAIRGERAPFVVPRSVDLVQNMIAQRAASNPVLGNLPSTLPLQRGLVRGSDRVV